MQAYITIVMYPLHENHVLSSNRSVYFFVLHGKIESILIGLMNGKIFSPYFKNTILRAKREKQQS
jgi:hypothetical protein